MPTLIDNIPKELRVLHRWVGVDASVASHLGFSSKTPLKLYEEAAASTTNSNTWSDFNDACECINKGVYDFVGFVFADDGFVGIDIDCGFDEFGMPTDEALEIINACESYTEVSKSGRGFHIICKGELPFKGKNNGSGWEIYKTGRYFVLTGQVVLFDEIREANDGIELCLERHFKDVREKSKNRDKRDSVIWKPNYKSFNDGKFPLCPMFDIVTSGSRHLSLVSYCGQMHRAGAHRDTLLEMAQGINEMYLSPPLPSNEVEQVVNSVTRYRR